MSQMITVDVEGALPLKRQMELLAMPKAMRRRLLARVAREVIKDSKRRVREQVDIDGMPFKERKRKRRRKMQAGLAKRVKTTRNTGLEANVGWYKPNDSRIAAKHHHGQTQVMNANSLKAGAQTTDKPATRTQAKSLIENGYRISKNGGKGSRKPSQRWIMENLTVARAGAILRSLKDGPAKSSWVVTLDARAWLGASEADINRHVNMVMNKMKQEIANGAR